MKGTNFICQALLASFVIAQPHQRHGHAARHENKGKREQAIVWVTDYDYVTEIIPATTTIWVTPGFVAPSPSTSSRASVSGAAGLFIETASPQSVIPQTSSVYVAPTPVDTAPAKSSVSSSTPAHVSVVASQVTSATIAPVYTPPTTTAAAPAPVSTSTASSSQSGECSSGSPCSGDMTYYDVGLGACGWTNDGTETVVALSHLLMGTQSNGNPYCGKSITVQYGGKTVTAKVVDKCMSCSIYSIDLSDAAFSALDDLDAGRVQATWYFN